MILAHALDLVEGSRARGARARRALEGAAARLRTAREAAETIKTCGCGRTYTRESWSRLLCVGVVDVEEEQFELRQCECFSTIAVLL
jgi:hypothetical protein